MIQDDVYTNLVGNFEKKYEESTTFIADLEEIGPLCITITTKNDKYYIYSRSILGLREFTFNVNNFDSRKVAFLISIDEYFRSVVTNWDNKIKHKKGFFESVLHSVGQIIRNPLENTNTNYTMNEAIQASMLKNMEVYKLENIKNRFAILNFAYALEIEKFVMRDFIQVEIPDECVEYIRHIKEVTVSQKEYEELIFSYSYEVGKLKSLISEFIETEKILFKQMKEVYKNISIYERIIEKLSISGHIENFKKLFGLCKKFVKELEVELTLNSEVNLTKIQLKEICNEELFDKIYKILISNIDYFDSYNEFASVYGVVMSVSLDKQFIEAQDLFDTFSAVLQRLTRFPLFLRKMLKCIKQDNPTYSDFKILVVKIIKFAYYIDWKQDLIYKNNKTEDLGKLYNFSGSFIDEIFYDKYKLILFTQSVLIIDTVKKIHNLLDFNRLDIHEIGHKSFCIFTRDSLISCYYFKKIGNFSVSVLYIECLGEIIRNRFVRNVRIARKKVNTNLKKIQKIVELDGEVFNIPDMSIKDKEWLLFKYKFFMDEVAIFNMQNKLVEID